MILDIGKNPAADTIPPESAKVSLKGFSPFSNYSFVNRPVNFLLKLFECFFIKSPGIFHAKALNCG